MPFFSLSFLFRNQLFACSASGKFVINPWQVGNSEDVENFDWETTELKVPDKLCVMRVNTATKQRKDCHENQFKSWNIYFCVFSFNI